MEKCLLSIDWDYFVRIQKGNYNSYIENDKNMVHVWYKRYFQSKARGKDIRKYFRLSPEVDRFWEKIKTHFCFLKETKVYVSDSHALSYDIAKETGCNKVYLFDSHADLGYGGPSSLHFEVHCANWLGKLLKGRHIQEAYIFYSPYTTEKPEDFKWINNLCNVRYLDLRDLDTGIEVSVVHICRSGAWTPPWLDKKFTQFVNALGISYEVIDCPERKWNPENLKFSDQVDYLLA